MMKKVFVLLACTIICAFISCGPSQEELDKQKRIDDSLFEKDRNNAIDNANKMLLDTVTTGSDSLVKKEDKKVK